MQKGKIILINGASSAGKSTLAAAVRDQLPEPFLRFSFDLFIDSYALPKVEKSAWRKIRPAVFAGYHRCWPALASAGNNLVIDHILEEKGWLHDLLNLLDGYDVFCVGLHCSLEELERREIARGDRGAGDARKDLEVVHKHIMYDLELNSEELLEQNVRGLVEAWQKRATLSAFDKMAANGDFFNE